MSAWLLGLAGVGLAMTDEDPLGAWQAGPRIALVAPKAECHTIHAYFNTCPESPDGTHVLFYASSAFDGEHGEIRIRHRATGKETVLARAIHAEDAHRAVCQQWVSHGRRVVYHGQRDERWFVAVVDVETGEERILAHDRLAGWGRPDADVVPLYGLHWNPGRYRDLELVDVASGDIVTAVTADAVQSTYPDFIAAHLLRTLPGAADEPIGSSARKTFSIFFPVLSPDRQRVFFKLATPGGGDPRSGKASTRLGLVCYDLAEQRFLYLNEKWGHPSWHPDSRTIVEAGHLLFDSDTGEYRRIPDLPPCRGDHPSVSPDGKLLVTDTTLDRFGGEAAQWGILVADVRGGKYAMIHRFDNSQGARSWRRSHPHPVFSPDGRRIYFNVSDGRWTRLHVAEIAASPTQD